MSTRYKSNSRTILAEKCPDGSYKKDCKICHLKFTDGNTAGAYAGDKEECLDHCKKYKALNEGIAVSTGCEIDKELLESYSQNQ